MMNTHGDRAWCRFNRITDSENHICRKNTSTQSVLFTLSLINNKRAAYWFCFFSVATLAGYLTHALLRKKLHWFTSVITTFFNCCETDLSSKMIAELSTAPSGQNRILWYWFIDNNMNINWISITLSISIDTNKYMKNACHCHILWGWGVTPPTLHPSRK